MNRTLEPLTTSVIEKMQIIFFFQAEDGIRDKLVTGVQTCALPISGDRPGHRRRQRLGDGVYLRERRAGAGLPEDAVARRHARSEEHTSELQSLAYLVCRLLLEKKKINIIYTYR